MPNIYEYTTLVPTNDSEYANFSICFRCLTTLKRLTFGSDINNFIFELCLLRNDVSISLNLITNNTYNLKKKCSLFK